RQGGARGGARGIRGTRAPLRSAQVVTGETFRRVIQAIPAIVFAIVIVAEGGIVFALGLIGLGVICLHELYRMMRRARPIDVAGFVTIAALCMTALYGHRGQLVLVLVLSLLVTF